MSAETLRRLFTASAPHFDVERIAPSAVVAIRDEDESVRLVGWDETEGGWRVVYVDGRETVVSELADPYLMRRVWVLYRDGVPTRHKHDPAPDLDVLHEALSTFRNLGGAAP